jgi:hypothetical protein
MEMSGTVAVRSIAQRSGIADDTITLRVTRCSIVQNGRSAAHVIGIGNH